MFGAVTARIARDAQGRELFIEGLVEDITEQHRALEQMIRRERDYRDFYEASRDGYIRVDLEGRVRESNHAIQKMLGYTHEELEGLSHEARTPAVWRELEARIVEEQVMERGYSDVYEKEYIARDGRRVPVEARMQLQRNADGSPRGIWTFVRDIREKKRVETALRDSEQTYRMLVETVLDAIHIIQDMRIRFANAAFCRMLGYSPEETVGLDPFQTVHPEDRELLVNRHTRRMNGEAVPNIYAFRSLTKNGKTVWTQLSVAFIQWEGRRPP